MNSGMYAALSGNLSALRRLEVISNNLANAATPGFKGDQIQFSSVLAGVKNPTQGPAFSNEQYSTNFSQGVLQKSENPLDLALNGEGFFVVNTPQGTAYTRQGNFQRAAGGALVTSEGYEVQGKNGPISLKKNGRIEVDTKGVVTVDGVAAGTLAQVDFPQPYALSKLGGGLFVPADPGVSPIPSSAEVRQGYLESSNVSVIVEMARMIEASRYFESCARAVRSYDELASKAANDLGRV